MIGERVQGARTQKYIVFGTVEREREREREREGGTYTRVKTEMMDSEDELGEGFVLGDEN